MSKFKTWRAASVEDLVAASRKVSRDTRLRRWMINHWLCTLIMIGNISIVQILLLNMPIFAAIVGTAGAAVLFLVWPLLMFVWRLRVELAVITVITAVWWALPSTTALIVFVVVIVIGVAVPQVRRFTKAQFWCVVTKHRMRGLFERQCSNKVGRVPWMLWTKATPVGEHVTVWLPSGLAFDDIEKLRIQIAAACWAKETRITKHLRWSHIVAIDVIRRDHFARPITADVVDSYVGKLDGEKFKTADEYVNEFLSTIKLEDLAVNDPVEAENRVTKQRINQAAETAGTEDPF